MAVHYFDFCFDFSTNNENTIHSEVQPIFSFPSIGLNHHLLKMEPAK